MRTLAVYLAGPAALAAAVIVAVVISKTIAKKKGLPLPGAALLGGVFILSALAGWGVSWLCAFSIKGSALGAFARFTTVTITWYISGVGVALAGAIGLGKSRSGTLAVITLPWLLCFAVLLAAFSFPTGRSLHELEDRLDCASNLRQVYLALKMYAEEHDDQLPPRVDAILNPYLGGCKELLHCPNAEANEPYGYHPSARIGSPAVLMWDQVSNHANGRNVLFADGEVKWLSEEEFKAVAEGVAD